MYKQNWFTQVYIQDKRNFGLESSLGYSKGGGGGYTMAIHIWNPSFGVPNNSSAKVTELKKR